MSSSTSSTFARLVSCLVPLSLLVAAACGQVEEESPPQLASVAQNAATPYDFQYLARMFGSKTLTGDFNGDGITDALNYWTISDGDGWGGGPPYSQIHTAFSDGSGHISVTGGADTLPSGLFSVGDFDGDGKDEFALLTTYLHSQRAMVGVVTKSDGEGNYVRLNAPGRNGADFPQYFLDWADWPGGGVRMLACDINGDHKDDLVLTGPSNWDTIPIAFSRGDASFYVTNHRIWYFHDWTEDRNAKLACDDFNGDGRDDLVVLGGAGWSTVPVAFSRADVEGTFTVTNIADSFWSTWAAQARTQLVTGDVNGDGDADIILMGGYGWDTIRVGFSTGTGAFGVNLSSPAGLPLWSQTPYALARGGDFNGDGKADFALFGGDYYWDTLPIGNSNGDASFETINEVIPAPPYPSPRALQPHSPFPWP